MKTRVGIWTPIAKDQLISPGSVTDDLNVLALGNILINSALKSSKKGNTKGAKPDDESSDDDGFSYEDLPEEEMSDEGNSLAT